ncbi:Oxygen regulatory protein NreC [termite gut metagenome]|jgi:DNA-binding NarL/FixJ family response regulator|uniref:Oxygen regulatory protein NreC n=1 Tax=termite gut metagenome TaxID=433724 RepID=A0A5J4SV92_9ZZZZ
MKNDNTIRIAIAETSLILRSGLTNVLKRLPNLRIQPVELASLGALNDCLNVQPPDILIVNPVFSDFFDVTRFRNANAEKNIRVVAFVNSLIDSSLLSKYDDFISVLDDLDVLALKIGNLQNIKLTEEESDNTENLSQREKEIVICIVKGMTNKEIADKLYLSIHTIITHRRNISKKLQIHSTAGLTIYAIVNKLIELKDIEEKKG